MRLLSIALLLTFALSIAAAHSQSSVDPKIFDANSGNTDKGRAIVVGANLSPAVACFRCHGVNGRGDSAAAFPRLSQQAYTYLYVSLKDYAAGVRQNAVMTPIAKELTDAQMRDVSAYYASQSGLVEDEGSPPAAPEMVDPTLLQYGAAIAAVGNADRGIQGCINCHGPEGRGLPPTYPYLAGQYANYLEAQLKAWKTGERGSDRLTGGVMQYIAKQMSAEDIRAVAQYYAAIRFSGAQRPPAESTIKPLPSPARVSPAR